MLLAAGLQWANLICQNRISRCELNEWTACLLVVQCGTAPDVQMLVSSLTFGMTDVPCFRPHARAMTAGCLSFLSAICIAT